ncbi:MAG: glycoside hydrolase family 16 protein [Treponema sp.]|nr:glycoside hydrolase family 16 protein [Treponema sp.]
MVFLVMSCEVGEVIPPPPSAPPMSVPGPTPFLEYDPNPVPRGWENRPGRWELVWRDEFSGGTGDNFHNGLNLDNWTADTGTGLQYGLQGWGNGERQYYSRANVRVENGMLILEAGNDGRGGMPFTSGKVTTGGNMSSASYGGAYTPERFSISEGFIEARIRAPRGVGFWPAFWTLGTNVNRFGNGGEQAYRNWPYCGEIDIMEMRGGQEWRHTAAIHHGTSFRAPGHPDRRYWYRHSAVDVRTTGLPQGMDMASDFHVYGVRWDADSIDFYFNGLNWYSIDLNRLAGGDYANAASFVAATGQLINLNLAVGGGFIGGATPQASLFAENAPFENRSLMIDWVRVYRRVGDTPVIHVHGDRMPDNWVPAF